MANGLRCGVIVCLLHAIGTSTWAKDIYVDNARGSDWSEGNAPIRYNQFNGPVQTIRRALQFAGPGDRIVLLPTGLPIEEEVIIDGRRLNGSDLTPITIEGNGTELVGARKVWPEEWSYHGRGVYRLEQAQVRYGALFANTSPFTRIAVEIPGMSPQLGEHEYAIWDGACWIRLPIDKKVSDYRFDVSARRVGLFVHRSNGIVIRNLHFRGYAIDGAQVHGPASVRFEHCRFSNNGRSGLANSTNAQVKLVQCVVDDNGAASIVDRNFGQLDLQSVALIGSPEPMLLTDSTSNVTRQGEPPAKWVVQGLRIPLIFTPPSTTELAELKAKPTKPVEPSDEDKPMAEAMPAEPASPKKKASSFFD